MVQALVIDKCLAQRKGGQFSGVGRQDVRLFSGRLKNDVLFELRISWYLTSLSRTELTGSK